MLNKEEIETQRFTDEEIKIVKGYIKERLKWKDWDNKAFYITMNAYTLVKHIENIESDKQKLIEKLEKDIVNITKTMQDGKHCDDYSRCRLKAYRTKTKEILEILKKE